MKNTNSFPNPIDRHPSGYTTYTDTSSMSSQSADSNKERERIEAAGSFGFENMDNFPGRAENNADVEGALPDQRGGYTIPDQGGPPGARAPDLRERYVHGNQYYNPGHPGSAGSVPPPPPGYPGSVQSYPGSVPPPPQGYAYGHEQPQANCYNPSLTANTYQRYTFIIVCCLAFTSLLQISRGGLGGQPITFNKSANFKNSWVPVSNNGESQPYYNNNDNINGMAGDNGNRNGNLQGGNGNGNLQSGNGMNMNTQVNMQQNGDMQNNNNNMIQDNGNGPEEEMDNQNQQEGGDGGDFFESDTAQVVDEGMEKYPLTELSHFKDNWDEWEPTDVPMFFHIPKAGGSTVKDIIGTCHRFVMATETGVTDGHANDEEIAVVYPGGIGPKGQDRSPFVNVDTTTVEGIARAQEMGFADSGLADAVVTYFLYEANELFTTTAKGRIFTVFRHPIERSISMFFYIQVADWEPTYDPSLRDMSIEDYAKSPKMENNWLTRQLSNTPEGDLSDDDLNLAMEVIRRKVMVGLMTEIEATMERFERFFRWTFHVNPPNQDICRETLLGGGSNTNSKNKKKKPEPGSEAWDLLAAQNNYDLQLYEYVESLFVEQEQFVADIPADYRNIDATCCKCDPATFPPEGFSCPLAILF